MTTARKIISRMEEVIVGKRPVIEEILAALLAGGHVLIEDVPGVAKTMLARALARVLDVDFGRIQMTPDLLPADLTGTGIWDEKKREFVFHEGPIFAQILLADELNRATPRTQAGLLEAMEERTVTADGARHCLPWPFFVIATQNPIEQNGVFPLPEAQLDRFLIQIRVGYPSHDEEILILEAQAGRHPIETLEAVSSPEEIKEMSLQALAIHVEPNILDYIVRIVEASRQRTDIILGGSPRASLGMHRLARALAYLEEAEYVRPDHVKRAAPPILRHRIILTPQARLAGTHPDTVIDDILENVEPPLYVGSRGGNMDVLPG